MIETVVLAHSWLPFDVYRFYLDDEDALGLVYWYEVTERNIINSWTKEKLEAHKKSLTVENRKEFDKRHNPKNEVNVDTGEWYLKQ